MILDWSRSENSDIWFIANDSGNWVATYQPFPEINGYITSVEGGYSKYFHDLFDVELFVIHHLGGSYGIPKRPY